MSQPQSDANEAASYHVNATTKTRLIEEESTRIIRKKDLDSRFASPVGTAEPEENHGSL